MAYTRLSCSHIARQIQNRGRGQHGHTGSVRLSFTRQPPWVSASWNNRPFAWLFRSDRNGSALYLSVICPKPVSYGKPVDGKEVHEWVALRFYSCKRYRLWMGRGQALGSPGFKPQPCYLLGKCPKQALCTTVFSLVDWDNNTIRLWSRHVMLDMMSVQWVLLTVNISMTAATWNASPWLSKTWDT